ncbi:MAG: Transmembrane protease serine 11D [Marteilia pararefringens]
MGRGRTANKHSNLSRSEDTVGLLTNENRVTSGYNPWQSIKAKLALKCTRKSKRFGILVCVTILVCVAILLGMNFANIVGGVEAKENSWPWQVSIQIGEVHYGSGSLINDQWVLTAAHVVEELDKKDRSEREYRVASVHIHPQFFRKTWHYDIALVKLDEKVRFGANISPVCLVEAEADLPLPGTKCFVTGWGITEMQSVSNKLREVDLKLISQDVCKQSDFNKTRIKDDMICAGNVKDGKGPCIGDSGGPLLYLDPKNGKWTQIGITSWGYRCGDSDHPSVFQRVDISKEWIEGIINEN